MDEWRIPDPTLRALGIAAVYVTEPLHGPSIAHRRTAVQIGREHESVHGIEPANGDFQNAYDACWFAVPCREPDCFPDAPPLGHRWDATLGRPFHDVDPGLAWQVINNQKE